MSLGGTSGSAIQGADTGTDQAWRIILFGVINPPTGVINATASWTGSAGTAIIGFVAATGVDQTTGFSGGTFTSSASTTSLNLTVLSNNGDLTATVCKGSNTNSTNQPQRWAQYTAQKGDTGPGTNTPTHIWTDSLGLMVIAGANFVSDTGIVTGLGRRLQGFHYSQGG
jgi:hypothetical protein